MTINLLFNKDPGTVQSAFAPGLIRANKHLDAERIALVSCAIKSCNSKHFGTRDGSSCRQELAGRLILPYHELIVNMLGHGNSLLSSHSRVFLMPPCLIAFRSLFLTFAFQSMLRDTHHGP